MKKHILLLICFICLIASCNQQSNCSSFKTGHFLISKDSLFENPIHLFKTKNSQKQLNRNGDTLYAKVTWLNDCSYILTFDKNKMKLSPFQLNINERGGILVEFGIPKEDIMPYTSVIKGESKTETFKGFLKKID